MDYTDLPVEEEYVRTLTPLVTAVRQRSKWLNAVSVLATRDQIERMEALPFVRELDAVNVFAEDPSLETPVQVASSAGGPAIQKASSADSLKYGASFQQLDIIDVPSVHAQGYHGEGVIIGMFDNGVRLLTHEAFDSLKIIATRDFVDHKTSVVPLDTNSVFGSHGVNTLSTIGGYVPGVLIGPAFKAQYILARTENDSSETPIEEDNWVAAIEWADSLGVQVTSTSLGYLVFDSPYTSLTWGDMNGHTAAISIAATIAARKGIVVVNSAGNNYSDPLHNTLDAPADADSIIAAGAVNLSGNRAAFSSVGPTTDVPPRIKPDVMAPGVDVLVATATDPHEYGKAQGTSFSCPLTAGVVALLVNSRPTSTPMEIINALRNTANNAANPNNFYGWGVIDALRALNRLAGRDTLPPGVPATFRLEQNYPNPFNPKTTIVYDVPEPSVVTLAVYDILGREVRLLVNSALPASRYFQAWDGTDNRGEKVSSGVYFSRLTARKESGATVSLTGKMMLVR
jgi:subtilisin family serine protease